MSIKQVKTQIVTRRIFLRTAGIAGASALLAACAPAAPAAPATSAAPAQTATPFATQAPIATPVSVAPTDAPTEAPAAEATATGILEGVKYKDDESAPVGEIIAYIEDGKL